MSESGHPRVLVVEDNPKTAENLTLYLTSAGYGVTVAGDGYRGLEEARSGRFDLVVLDLMLPGLDGLELCRTLRRESKVPVLMLTARTLEDERVRGLEIGADDYVTKPFSPREVTARVTALLRRAAWDAEGTAGAAQTSGVETYRGLTLDPERHEVRVDGRPAELTATELKLLATLMRSPGRVFSRAALIDQALGHDFEGMDRTVDAHIMKLRRKIEPDRAHPTYVRTVFGVGYNSGTTMTSLRLRLLLAVGLVVAAGIGAVGVYSSRVTRVEFQRFADLEEESLEARDRRHEDVRARLEEHYRRQGGWEGVRELLAAMAREPSWRSFLVLIDRQGELLAVGSSVPGEIEIEIDGDHGLVIEQRVELDDGRLAVDQVAFRGPSWTLKDAAGSVAGSLYVVPMADTDRERSEFLGSVNRWLWIGVTIAGALALILTALLSRRILGPIGELTAGVRRMADGELDQRVAVRSRDEIGELARAFNAMAASLARAEELRGNMVSDVAHELRTPLTNMRGQLEAVQDGLLAPRPAVIASLHEEVMLLSRLVDDLQELALAEAGQLRFEVRDLDLGEEVRRAAGATRAAPGPSGPTIDVEVPEATRVRADSKRLGQVLRNLLQNAVSHTPDGGEIAVSARPRRDDVEVAVRNTGDGIEARHLPYVFERFYRTDPSRHHTTGGAGLGLAIVKQLVEAQGGRVWAESVPGRDCTFLFTLPRSP